MLNSGKQKHQGFLQALSLSGKLLHFLHGKDAIRIHPPFITLSNICNMSAWSPASPPPTWKTWWTCRFRVCPRGVTWAPCPRARDPAPRPCPYPCPEPIRGEYQLSSVHQSQLTFLSMASSRSLSNSASLWTNQRLVLWSWDQLWTNPRSLASLDTRTVDQSETSLVVM